jgi:putative FmdB family regulatory protein
MPIYEYRCDKGHTFEVMQRMTDDPIAVCETCGGTVTKVMHSPAVHFKGSGFYNTDYGTRKRAREQSAKDSSESKSSDSKSSDDSSTSSDSKKSESKSDTKKGDSTAAKAA